MLGKLIKYDLRYGAKTFIMLAAIMLAFILAIIAGVKIQNAVMAGLSVALAVIGFIVFYVFYVVIAVRMLYSQLVGPESVMGYMLPASARTLLLSKIVSLFIWALFAIAVSAIYVCMAGAVLNAMIPDADFQELWRVVLEAFDEMGIVFTANDVAAYIISVAVSIIYFIIMIALCCAIANIPALKERGNGVVVGVLTFIFGNWLINLLSGIVYAAWFEFRHGTGSMSESVRGAMDFLNGSTIVNTVEYAVLSAVFFFLASWLLENKKSV